MGKKSLRSFRMLITATTERLFLLESRGSLLQGAELLDCWAAAAVLVLRTSTSDVVDVAAVPHCVMKASVARIALV